MFQHKTVMILGAGASCEAGLPAGDALLRLIVDALQPADVGGSFRDARIERAVQDKAVQLAGVNEWRQSMMVYRGAARLIVTGLPLAPSIDHFLDAHSGNEDVELLGKLAIASTILEAERSSRLAPQRTTGVALDPNAVQGTWYTAFGRMITQAVRRDAIEKVFQNLTIISFNYDRCIEHFLFVALQAYFAVDQKAAAKALSGLTIIHPYGVVGSLPWQNPEAPVPFGGANDLNLLEVAGLLKTFTESVESGTVSAIRDAVAEAQTLIVLGFGYHPQNVQLLRAMPPAHAERMFATMAGISAWDVSTAVSLLQSIVSGAPAQIHHNAQTCSDLFQDYRLRLSQEVLAPAPI